MRFAEAKKLIRESEEVRVWVAPLGMYMKVSKKETLDHLRNMNESAIDDIDIHSGGIAIEDGVVTKFVVFIDTKF